MIRIVTVPLDLTAEADRALGPGVALARQLGAALELAVVTSPGLDTSADTYELQARAAQLVGVTTTTLVLPDDDVRRALVPLVADPDRLVCMASHGRGRIGELLAPNLSLDLVGAAHRPAVIVGPRLDWWPGPVRTLFLGVDERGTPAATLELVATWAAALGADVGLVRTQTPDGREDAPDPGALALEDARAWMEGRGLEVSVRRLVGEPAVTLADTADRASRRCPLVVVTGRVAGRRERVLRGSVTRRLVSVSPVPTLVVPVTVEAGAPRGAGVMVAGR